MVTETKSGAGGGGGDGDNVDRLRELGWINSALVPGLTVWFTNLCFFMCLLYVHFIVIYENELQALSYYFESEIFRRQSLHSLEKSDNKKCMTFCTFAV